MLEPFSPIVNQDKVQEMQRNRVSISAEVFGKYNCKNEYKPKVTPKSQENKDKIKNRLSQAFMFMNLDENEMSVVIDAMDHKTVAQEEFIIKEKDLGEELYIVECG
jgi:cAMP-dependent protein kinase regulator